MNLSFSIGPVVALIAGILILLVPRLLNYIIALYLIIVGVLGLTGMQVGGLRAENASEAPPAAVHDVAPATRGQTPQTIGI